MNKPFIVAEISANHLGSIGRAVQLVHAAVDAGADAVKFQLFDPAKMAPAGMVIADGPWKGWNARQLYTDAATPRAWLRELFYTARERGVEAFASVFDVDGLAFLEEIGCPRYKIASFEITDLDLIRAVARTGKPMIISTGMATLSEIRAALLQLSGSESWYHVTLLKCTSAYPAQIEDANLATMVAMGESHDCEFGLSDHSLGNLLACAAVAMGASVIEKHLTLCRSDGGPDAGFSTEPDEFAQMVKECRATASAIGTVRYGPTASELPQVQLKGRTLAARNG